MSGLKDLRVGVGIIRLPGYDTPSAPEVPEASPIQTTLPTSAYGQTMPVVWGKCRLPGAYIWVPPIVTVTSTHTEWWDQITTTTSNMSCRLRFARPLVPNSTWTMRKLYCNGTLIYDASQNYRAKGLKFRAYDGKSAQDRDPTQTKEEGTTNVSAHRGYLDIVLTDFDIQGFGAPPTFEAEWIQDGASTHRYDAFSKIGTPVIEYIVPVWERGTLYGIDSTFAFGQFSIYAMREFFVQAQSESSYDFHGFRYSRTLDLLIYMGQNIVGEWKPFLTDAVSGIVATTSGTVSSAGHALGSTCLVDTPVYAFYAGFTDQAQLYLYRADLQSIELMFDSGTAWQGYSSIQCLVPGEVRGDDFDIWVCADADIVKLTVSLQGALKSTTVVATLSDDLRYIVYDDGGFLVVWTDAAHVLRVNGATGEVVFNKSVPYQIQAFGSRLLGDPDLSRLVNELFFAGATTSYFTDLSSGATRSVTGASTLTHSYYYDGQTEVVITTNGSQVPERVRIIAGDGTLRLLSDFLTDLMIYGGDFDPSDVQVENVDDLIQGAVVDITAGARDIARAVIEPYSIAMFER
jgi:hypothetical protein